MLSLIKIQKLCNLRENHLSLMEMISDKNNNLDKLYYNDFLCKKRRIKMKEPETGKKENTGKSGYSITTWRLHLWCRHPEWLRTTQEFYNRIAEFYYNLLLNHTDLWEMGSQQTLRELEIMSIPGRGGRIPSDPLPWQKVPLYFRRAAANEGIASAKSYLSRFAQDEKIGRAEKLNAAVVQFYALKDEILNTFRQIHYIKILIALSVGSIVSLWVKILNLECFFSLVISSLLFFGAYGFVLLILKEELFVEIFNTIKNKII